MKAAEEAVKAYCDPSVFNEYQKLNKEAKKKMVEAMVAGNKSVLVHQSVEAQRTGLVPPNAASRQCPLVRALIERGCQTDILKEDWVAQCREMLASWGNDSATEASVKIEQYQQVIALQKQSPAYNVSDSSVTSLLETNQKVVKNSAAGNGKAKDWSRLKKIAVKDLSLFSTSYGCYVEGYIVGEAIQPMVGGTTLIQDEAGSALIVCFYNMLPEGIRGNIAEPLLQSKFPMGAKVRVAEPFMKIFGDGQRGIRVDDPSDIEVVIPGQTKVLCMEDAMEQATDLLEQKQYLAAMELFLDGIRLDDFVPTVLSNRSQVHIIQEKWGAGLCDAAASLTIRPDSEKTWMRYNLCCAKFTEGLGDNPKSKRPVYEMLIEHLKPPSKAKVSSKGDPKKQAEQLKKSGNDAFQKGNLERAVQLYSEALLAAGSVLCDMMTKLASCALEIAACGDVIAFSVATLRIAADERSLQQLSAALTYLGEYKLAKAVLGIMPSNKNLNAFRGDLDKAERAHQMMAGLIPLDAPSIQDLLQNTPCLLGNYQGPVETFMATNERRGVRAARDMEEGEIVLVERAIATFEFDPVGGDRNAANAITNRAVDGSSIFKLKAAMSRRVNQDGVLAKVLDPMLGGKPLLPLGDLIMNIDMFPLLRPSHREYFNDEEDLPRISQETVESLLDATNGIGKLDSGDKGMDIFPAITVLNHGLDPNCDFMLPPMDGVRGTPAVVITKRPVRKGEELCIRSSPDNIPNTDVGN